MKEPKFNIDEDVWIGFDPDSINCPDDPVFQGRVTGRKVVMYQGIFFSFPNEDREDGDIEYEYDISFGLDNVRRKESDIFKTSDEAADHLVLFMENRIIKRENDLIEYRKVLHSVKNRLTETLKEARG